MAHSVHRLKRVYHPYHKWEDYNNGMYKDFPDEQKEELIQKAVNLLSDSEYLKKAMKSASMVWVISAEENLTNISCNRQAWLGAAACCFEYGVPEYLTKEAWNRLTEETQNKANNIADEVIKEWKNKYYNQVLLTCQKNL